MNPARISLIWPLFVISIAVFWFAQSLGILNGPAVDLVLRAWPVLLVFAGLVLLIGRRVRFGNVAALILCVALIGGIASAAFGQQSTRVRTDNRKTFAQAIDPQIETVKLVVNMLNTEVIVTPGEAPTPTVQAEFTGSRDSRLTSDFQIDGTTGTFTLVESQSSGLPSLEGLGRGQLKLTLPAGAAIKQTIVILRSRTAILPLLRRERPSPKPTLPQRVGSLWELCLPDSRRFLSRRRVP